MKKTKMRKLCGTILAAVIALAAPSANARGKAVVFVSERNLGNNV